jgi:hypothetical protein
MDFRALTRTVLVVASLLQCLPALAASDPPAPSVLLLEPQHVQDGPPDHDRAGIRRDTLYFIGYQAAAAGVIALWPDPDSEVGFDHWWHNVTHPRWDPDRAVVNYVLHPYWGAAYYTRARERGLDRTQSFWYSVLLSTIFEYSAEAMVEPVSYQDLVVTPVIGSLLGEFVFAPWRAHIRARPGPLSITDHAALVLTDPLGAINSAVGGLLGIEAQVSAGPMLHGGRGSQRALSAGGAAPPAGHHVPPAAGWGLQLRATW